MPRAGHPRPHGRVGGRSAARGFGGQLPGAKLSEQALSESLAVSRNTLREAFTVLAGEAVVTRIPNRGVFVPRPGRRNPRDLPRPAHDRTRGGALGATDLDLDEMGRIVGRGPRRPGGGVRAAMADANQEFHQALIRGSGSIQLQP